MCWCRRHSYDNRPIVWFLTWLLVSERNFSVTVTQCATNGPSYPYNCARHHRPIVVFHAHKIRECLQLVTTAAASSRPYYLTAMLIERRTFSGTLVLQVGLMSHKIVYFGPQTEKNGTWVSIHWTAGRLLGFARHFSFESEGGPTCESDGGGCVRIWFLYWCIALFCRWYTCVYGNS